MPEGSPIEIRWEMIEAIVSGRSAIDVPRLYVTSLDDASDFLACYGYDLGVPASRAQLEGFRVEAIEFIENELLDDEPLAIDPDVRAERDVRRLLLWASSDPGTERQLWACSLLRVMHTFAHSGSYFQEQYRDAIREQIGARFAEHIVERDGQRFLGRGHDAVPLAHFELKFTKSRKSLAMKLLHKVENVAADVFDWMGVRIVTRERLDALLAVRYLRAHNVVMFANVVPGRSRNTLLDLDELRHELDGVDGDRIAQADPEGLDRLRARIDELPYPTATGSTYNPYTAMTYRSIQFTCRQLIRVHNPHRGGLLRGVPERPASVIRAILERFGVENEVRFFFPYEVQVLDERSYRSAFEGLASHATYKRRQRYAVKRRLWGDRITELPPELTQEEYEAEERLQREFQRARLRQETTAEEAVGDAVADAPRGGTAAE